MFRRPLRYTEAKNLSPIHVNLPIGLSADVHIVKVSSVIFGVCASKEQLTTRLGVRVSVGQIKQGHPKQSGLNDSTAFNTRL